MPRMDGTGPAGQGPLTGRGMGRCGGGTRGGWGYGRGQGWRARFSGLFRSPKNDLQLLEEEEKALKEELKAVQDEKEALKSK